MWQDLYTHSISAENPFYQAWKLFKGYIFFLGHLVGHCIFKLNARETNLMKKRSVSLWKTVRLHGKKLQNVTNLFAKVRSVCELVLIKSLSNGRFSIYSIPSFDEFFENHWTQSWSSMNFS